MAARKALGRWLFFAGAHDGQFGGDAARGGEQDVAGAAGNVGDAQVEQRLGGIGLLERVGDQVVERMLDERLDEIVRRVVRAGGGALVALGKVELDALAGGVENRLEFEQAFIDRAELFDVERGVIDADESGRCRDAGRDRASAGNRAGHRCRACTGPEGRWQPG